MASLSLSFSPSPRSATALLHDARSLSSLPHTINTNRGGGGGGSLHSLHPPYPPLPTAASIMRARENTITASFLSSAARRCVNHTCTLVGIYFLDLGKRTMDGKGSSPTAQHTPSCPWRSIFFAHSKKRGNRPGSLRLSLLPISTFLWLLLDTLFAPLQLHRDAHRKKGAKEVLLGLLPPSTNGNTRKVCSLLFLRLSGK